MEANQPLPHQKNLWRGILLYWVPALAFATAISVGSGLSPSLVEGALGASGQSSIHQVLLHAGEFAVLSVLIFRVAALHLKWSYPALALLAFGVSVAYAGADELHQAFVPGRVASWVDIGADSLGAGAALIGVGILKWVWQRS